MMYELGAEHATKDVHHLLFQFDPAAIVAVTGAGISVASGLPLGTEQIGEINLQSFFRRELWGDKPSEAYQAYRTILSSWRKAIPNRAHQMLAVQQIRVITQNIDGLHRDAGSEGVIELHGNLRELRCPSCEAVYSSELVWEADIPNCPRCRSQLYPGITLEGEPVRHFARAVEWVASADAVVIVGTQLSMDPIRQLREIAQDNGALLIWISDCAEQWIPILFNGIS